jgi:hypothetical protein
MRTISFPTDNFDQVNTFTLNAGKRSTFPARCSLHRDYEKVGDGVLWAMQHSGCIKSTYTDDDRAESARLQAETPLTNGETVLIDGSLFTVRVLGDFSDAAIFDPA